jgi:hypothetical protein
MTPSGEETDGERLGLRVRAAAPAWRALRGVRVMSPGFQAYCLRCKRFTEHDDRARGMRCAECGS